MVDKNIQNTVFEIPKDGYLAFDALSMKQLITENLNKTGVFTDQNYEASYLSNIINIIAYSYNALMFYLNKTSTESMFTESQIYENMNRIVKMLGYNPIGFQSAILPFELQAANLDAGLYVIPRYSYFIKNGIAYSFNEDVIFNKFNNNTIEVLTDVNATKVLYQGRFYEYPVLISTGQENETFIFTTDDSVLVDHFNIFIYRYNVESQTWEQWTQTENLFLENQDAKKYEIRLNPEQNYEIKFGNDINGMKLNTNDRIAIYYLQSDGANGEIAATALDNAAYTRFLTTQFNEIYNDLSTTNATIINNITSLIIKNPLPSTRSKSGETPDQIRASAPTLFKTQYRLVTSDDYKTYVLNNFINFIQDASVANNWEYISNRLKYYYNLGLTNPDKAGAPLYAQVNFADSCNFNHVYITIVPKTGATNINNLPTLTTSQKQIIINSITPRKTLTSEIVILDPVYIGVSIALPADDTSKTLQDTDNSSILIVKTPNTRRSDDDITADIQKIFSDTFNPNNLKLGQSINLIDLKAQVLSVNGVSEVYTINTITNSRAPGLLFYVFDPIYSTEINTATNEIQVKDFQFLYYYNFENFSDKIRYQQKPSIYEKAEF